MQSLPTALTTAQLDGIIASLQGLPSSQVTRHSDVVTVHATRKATGEQVKVLSAITSNGAQWHVMAVPGLISTTFTN
jgi:alkyl hydroperoxide reductase subunit AhpF